MLAQTRGIFLHGVKFGENSLIATIYTEKFGRQAYIVNSAKGRKAGNKSAMLQPLFLLDLIVYHKEAREVQRIKEFKTYVNFQAIPFDIRKSTQAIFIAEILYRLLHEEESNEDLFRFCENAITFLDLADEGVNNFQLFFLSRLTGFLGILPHISDTANGSFFDLRKGTSRTVEPAHPLFMDKYETSLFLELVNMKISQLQELKIDKKTRQDLLLKIIEYYRHHFDSMGEIRSLAIIKEVFSD